MNIEQFDIIGAGIGGLTLAIALKNAGHQVRVFEQAREIRPVGAGIILANNAMQVYKELGLYEEIKSKGKPVSSMNIVDQQLRILSGLELTYFENKYQAQNIAIHRAELLKILLEQLNNNQLYVDHKFIAIHDENKKHILKFENGKQYESHALIGCDGIHSPIRQTLFPSSIVRSANQKCWRGIASYALPQNYSNSLYESWGRGLRFGFVEIDENQVYWYALARDEHVARNRNIPAFDEFHPLINDLIQNTNYNRIHYSSISDLKPIPCWHKNNIILLGDAAHATTPNLGQGACQAIEDAHVLAYCISQGKNFSHVASDYQKLRMPKAHSVTKASWHLGKMAHWKGKMACIIRNTMMKLTPASVNRKRTEDLFRLPV